MTRRSKSWRPARARPRKGDCGLTFETDADGVRPTRRRCGIGTRQIGKMKVIELVLISFRLLACCYLNRATGNSAMNRFTLGQTMLDNMANLQGPSRVHFGVQFGLCKPSNTAEGESVHYVFACCALDSQTWLFVFRNYLRLDVGHQMDVARIRFARF